MRKKNNKKQIQYPYITIDIIDQRLADWLLITMISEEKIEEAFLAEKKLNLIRIQNQSDSENKIVERLSLIEYVNDFYNFYNSLANSAMIDMEEPIEDLIAEMEECKHLSEAINRFFNQEGVLAARFTALRLYKKGKFCEKYISNIQTDKRFEEQLDCNSKLLLKGFEYENWKTKAAEFILENNADEQRLEISEPSVDFKKRILEVLDEMEQYYDQEESAQSEELLNELHEKTKQIEQFKQADKKKDTLIKKMQKELAKVAKEQDLTKAKVTESNRQLGIKGIEIGQLRKIIEKHEQQEHILTRQLNFHKQDQQSVKTQLEKEMTEDFAKEIVKIREGYQNEIDNQLKELNNMKSHKGQWESKEHEMLETITKLTKSLDTLLNENQLLTEQATENQNKLDQLAGIFSTTVSTSVSAQTAQPERFKVEDGVVAVNKDAFDEFNPTHKAKNILEDYDDFSLFNIPTNEPI